VEGKIIFKGQTKDGKEYFIRYPKNGDAGVMTEYINTLSQEKTFIRFQGEKISLKDELKYLKGQLEKIQKKLTVQLLVICEGKIVGITGIDLRDRTEKHEGVFGISILKEFRNQGIGKIFLQLVLEEAEKNLPNLRIVTLEVFANNPIAQEMYKKFGFQEFGKLPEGIVYKGGYVDRLYMYKKVK
jgi:ribosomal protein S18 acetylase RimI-like enzyme